MISHNNNNKRYSSRPLKRFGQHWLRSEKVLSEIVNAAELNKNDRVLEIGGGKGVLTRRLLPEVDKLLTVEIDRNLSQKLREEFKDNEKFLLVEGDYLKLDLSTIEIEDSKFLNPNKVVANIPYNITGLILKKLLGTIDEPNIHKYESIVLLIQKEVGDRLVAVPGTKAYSAVSVRIQYLATCELICNVPAKAFYPKPKVDSVVVRLRPKNIDNSDIDTRLLQTIIKLGFASRRKMLRNNLKSIIDINLLNDLFLKLNLNPQSRAENLSLDDWIRLSKIISESKDIPSK